jgi:hypothetical protein
MIRYNTSLELWTVLLELFREEDLWLLEKRNKRIESFFLFFTKQNPRKRQA